MNKPGVIFCGNPLIKENHWRLNRLPNYFWDIDLKNNNTLKISKPRVYYRALNNAWLYNALKLLCSTSAHLRLFDAW